MKQSPFRDIDSRSVGEGIPSYFEHKINYHIYKSPPLYHIMCQLNPIQSSGPLYLRSI